MEDSEGVQHCPSCDSTSVASAMVEDRFEYGDVANPIELVATVQMFSCINCGETFTGEQAEAARASAVDKHLASMVPLMVEAIRAQHKAIDQLFAILISKTLRAEVPFYPSQSGQPWEAINLGKAALEAAGVKL